jgi:hypothetical protein
MESQPLASKDGEFLRKISHPLIWWLHHKLSNLSIPYVDGIPKEARV